MKENLGFFFSLFLSSFGVLYHILQELRLIGCFMHFSKNEKMNFPT